MVTRARQIIQIICLTIICSSVWASEYPIKLEKAKINTHDINSIQKGARSFATYCMVCHSLEYLSHDPVAKAAGITLDKMPKKNQKWWFETPPPDLSVIAKARTPDWIYTYLQTFYKDPKRPTGSNNLLADNTNMPNPFIGLQGEQILIVNKNQLFGEVPLFTRKHHYYSVLALNRAGSMPVDEFDKMTKNLVNFLVYASEPKKYTREVMGFWVLLFIAIFFILVYLLKNEYWKKIKK